MTTIVLIRHGEVAGIEPPRFRGRTDLPLTERGVRQAEVTRDSVAAHWTPTAVYCSPLSRCVRTADIVARRFGLEPITQPGLVDIDYGAWTDLAEDEVAARWPRESALWRRAPQTVRLPGGEMLVEVLARTIGAFDTILHGHPRDTVAVVAHDSVNRVILCHAMGLSLGSYWRLTQDPCGISTIDYVDGNFTIHFINQTLHLDTI